LPVGSFAANGNVLYDMHGDVWEWCIDFYGPYSIYPKIDPKGATSGKARVCCGGGWNDFARRCRSSYRDNVSPSYSDYSIGIPLVKSYWTTIIVLARNANRAIYANYIRNLRCITSAKTRATVRQMADQLHIIRPHSYWREAS
jgi:hypothetical protein